MGDPDSSQHPPNSSSHQRSPRAHTSSTHRSDPSRPHTTSRHRTSGSHFCLANGRRALFPKLRPTRFTSAMSQVLGWAPLGSLGPARNPRGQALLIFIHLWESRLRRVKQRVHGTGSGTTRTQICVSPKSGFIPGVPQSSSDSPNHTFERHMWVTSHDSKARSDRRTETKGHSPSLLSF